MSKKIKAADWETFLDLLERLLSSMTDQQRADFLHPWEHEKRLWWTYLPCGRIGLTLGDLTRAQRKLVHYLLMEILSEQGYAQVALIMALEDMLDRGERGRTERHSPDYWIILFGDERLSGFWAWRFEGQHISVNVVMVDGELSVTPLFLGACPARVKPRGACIAAPFALEESLALELMASMSSWSRRHALVAEHAPDDIYTGNASRVEGLIVPLGISNTEMSATSATILDELVDVYIGRLATSFARAQARSLWAGPLLFAWEGATEAQRPHYYRIQGRGSLIEYDNSAHDANHVHSVWRRLSADFGADLLKKHVAETHPYANETEASQAGQEGLPRD